MAATNLMIGIGAEYKGRGAFKQAETATQKLTKSVRNLAGAFGIAFGTQAVVNFARVSLKAFQESEAQQNRLARLLEVTNDASKEQIAVLTRQADALERLGVVSAGSISQVQSQLATFDLQILTINKLTPAILDYVTAEKGAAATADDFKAATNGLAQALNGNFASLTKTGFVLDDVTKELISTGTEAERAAAIVKVLDSTYKGFNRSLRDTPAGQFQILSNAADDARVIIGEGLTEAITQAFGGGDIDKAAEGLRLAAGFAADLVISIGNVAKISGFALLGQLGSSFKNRNAAKELGNTPFDPMAMKAPDLTPAFMALVKAQQKADALAVKRQKERTAELKKQTKSMKEQAALAKAKAVLDESEKVMNMDLIQNTAALMGKVTADETLRLKLQQAILLGNADSAGNLAQQLLASQLAAMKLSSTNPLGGFSDALKAALDGVRSLRDELAKLGAPKVGVPAMLTPEQLLEQDYRDVLADRVDPRFAALDAMRSPVNGGYSSYNRDLTPTELRIFIDPSAAAFGINAAVIDANANGSASTVNRNGFFEYGR
jgi:hypothetical protein